MNIDVEIKITEDNKENGACFVKHFSGRLDQYNDISLVKPEDERKFEEFLSGVLTNSGHMVRNSLLSNNKTRNKKEQKQESQLGLEELQYTLRLGTGHSLSGRIPLADLNLFSAPEVISEITNEKNTNKSNNHESFLLNKYYSHRNKRKNGIHIQEIEKAISTIMYNAIKKYESNISYGTDVMDRV